MLRATMSFTASLVLATAATAGERRNGEPLRDRVLVKLTADAARAARPTGGALGLAEFDALTRDLGVRAIRPVFRAPPRGRKDPAAAAALGLDRWLRVELGRERVDLAEVVGRLDALRSVEVAEADRVVLPLQVPNDPDWAGAQWDLQAARANAEGAWDLATDSSSLVIFVIDTGVETTHSDIAANLWANPGEIAGNGLDDEGNGYVDDVNGWNFIDDNNDVGDTWPHGIHVNGIIGAAGNNSLQVAGINWTCRLAQGRIFANGYGTWEAGAAATVYATDNGASVTNNSWGDTVPGPQVFDDARAYADAADVLQVAAAGNEGNTNLFWPAAYPEFVSVASTDSNDNLSWFSTHGDWIDMAAPGEGIYNLWVGNSATWLSGTSMASPHVAGAGALVRAVNPQLSNVEARMTLRLSADDLGTAGYDDSFGHGRLDITQAVTAANSIALSAESVGRPGTVTVSLHAPAEAGMLHVLLGSLAGCLPGIGVDGLDPTDFRPFPVNYDFLFEYQLNALNGFLAPNALGYLDANGDDAVDFHVIAGRFFQGRSVTVAWCSFDPNDLADVRFISAPLSFDVN